MFDRAQGDGSAERDSPGGTEVRSQGRQAQVGPDIHAPRAPSVFAAAEKFNQAPAPLGDSPPAQILHAGNPATVAGLQVAGQDSGGISEEREVAAAPVAATNTPFVGATRAPTANVPRASVAGHDLTPMELLSSAPVQTAAAQSESIFVQGSTVAIVIRDTALSDPQAVSCAFETARWLTGRTAALQRLVLNGRTIYQQPGSSGVDAPAAGRALVFAC